MLHMQTTPEGCIQQLGGRACYVWATNQKCIRHACPFQLVSTDGALWSQKQSLLRPQDHLRAHPPPLTDAAACGSRQPFSIACTHAAVTEDLQPPHWVGCFVTAEDWGEGRQSHLLPHPHWHWPGYCLPAHLMGGSKGRGHGSAE